MNNYWRRLSRMQRRIQGRGPGLLLDQMKGPKRNFFGAPPPLIWRSGSSTEMWRIMQIEQEVIQPGWRPRWITMRRYQNNWAKATPSPGLLRHCRPFFLFMGTLSKDVFERRTSTGSEAFSLFICLDANKLVLLSFFSLLKTIYPRVSTKPLPNDAKSPLPVDVRRSKTLLLKLPNGLYYWRHFTGYYNRLPNLVNASW